MTQGDLLEQVLDSAGLSPAHILEDDIARLIVHGNKVLGAQCVPGFEVEVEERADGIEAHICVKEGVRIVKPVHMCFGMMPEEGLQHIVLDLRMEAGSAAQVQAHCTFPNAVELTHKMDAVISVGPGADYAYFERHVHGKEGGVDVVPKAKVILEEGARYKTEFELIKGRVGRIDLDYDTECRADSSLEMIARISGRGNDEIVIREIGRLVGERARAVLQSHIALRDEAKAEIFNTLTASADGARGHVDCKEIVQDNAVAKAVPIVEVSHPGAHVTHEAAIGSVDSKQLETLLSRGLTEDEAVDLIIEGLLS